MRMLNEPWQEIAQQVFHNEWQFFDIALTAARKRSTLLRFLYCYQSTSHCSFSLLLGGIQYVQPRRFISSRKSFATVISLTLPLLSITYRG